MIKKIIAFLFLFCCFVNKSNADFFHSCGINEDNLKKINNVLKNGNSKFIPREIDEINNETFQQALYLYSFYKDGSNLPEEMMDIIGIDIIKPIPRYKHYLINYVLKKNSNNEQKINKELQHIKPNHDDYIFILKNKYFQPDIISDIHVNNIVKKVFMEIPLKIGDIEFFIKKYKSKITDQMLLQQIRFMLWNNNTRYVDSLASKIKNNELKKRIAIIKKFQKDVNKTTEYKIKLKNGKTKTRTKKLTKDQIIKICKPLLNKDEYIDLYCIGNDSHNDKLFFQLLTNNVNPVFLPQKWLTYRVSFVRNKINESQDGEEIDDDIYEIIANSGILSAENYYKQQFLSGLVAYIRQDYQNAILHFNNCAKHSKIAEYNAKAYYWLGISYLKNNNTEKAKLAFTKSKEHFFTMYGQLAATELNEDPMDNIRNYILSFREKPKMLCNDVNFVLGYLDQYKNKNQNRLSPLLSSYISHDKEKIKIFNALNVIQNDFQEQYAKALSVYSIKYDVVHIYATFPTIEYTDDNLIHAVIKQESNFRIPSVSNKGAAGIMQIMPSTGKVLARSMGIKYSYYQLLKDEQYNIEMGKFYIDQLLKRYDNNKILALASYNAGASNVERWISKNGDPRKMFNNMDVVEWIEKIPFEQTREYISKILGFEMVYDVINKINGDFIGINATE